MNINDLIEKFGDSDASIAKALGTSRQLVAHWRVKGIAPQRQAWIQVQTKGRLRADPQPEERDAP
jgi:hypothetical protein